MTKVICCRHGQSVANAGAATSDPLAIPLTEQGRRQAEEVALRWEHEPGLIVVSPAERAQATAAPTLRRFPHVPHEEWPIHEFTYLAPSRCAGTTADQRRGWVEAYWAQADATYVDGAGAESFAAFILRVDQAINALYRPNLCANRPALLFGHGQFINAMRWRFTQLSDLIRTDGAQQMPAFRAFDLKHPVGNCEPIPLDLVTAPTRPSN